MYIYNQPRTHQPETLEQVKRWLDSDQQYLAINAPTGFGKSFVPAQLAYEGYRVLSSVMTKSLQSQYEQLRVESTNADIFTKILGKNNYSCNGYGQQGDLFKEIELTADLCTCPDGLKEHCKAYCEYPIARNEFVHSSAGIINYAKFVSDRPIVSSIRGNFDQVITKGFDPEIIVLDEGHELPTFTMDRSGYSFNWKSKRLMQYTEPCQPIDTEPLHKEYKKLVDEYKATLPLPMARKQASLDLEQMLIEEMSPALRWLEQLLDSLRNIEPLHPTKGGDLYHYKWWQRLIDRVDLVIGSMAIEPLVWFAHSDNERLEIRPKTARYHFKKMFGKAPKVILMSATIYREHLEMLGIQDDCEYIQVPNVIPAKDRPVYDYDSPEIKYGTPPSDQKKHAQIIANIFNKSPDHWNGIVHFPSKSKSERWGEWLGQMTRRPVYVPEDGIPTDEAIEKWQEFERDNTGAICVAWNMMTGYDGVNVNVNVSGCVPFPNMGDRYTKARFNYDKNAGMSEIAAVTEQQQGRNRRGYDEHYGPNAEKLNCLVDGKFRGNWLRSKFSKDFKASLVRVK